MKRRFRRRAPRLGCFPDVDIYHNIESHEFPWVTTQHGYYGDAPPFPTRHTIFVSKALARAYDYDPARCGIESIRNTMNTIPRNRITSCFLLRCRVRPTRTSTTARGSMSHLAYAESRISIDRCGNSRRISRCGPDPSACQQAGATYVGDVRGRDKATLLAARAGITVSDPGCRRLWPGDGRGPHVRDAGYL